MSTNEISLRTAQVSRVVYNVNKISQNPMSSLHFVGQTCIHFKVLNCVNFLSK